VLIQIHSINFHRTTTMASTACNRPCRYGPVGMCVCCVCVSWDLFRRQDPLNNGIKSFAILFISYPSAMHYPFRINERALLCASAFSAKSYIMMNGRTNDEEYLFHGTRENKRSRILSAFSIPSSTTQLALELYNA